MDWYDYQLQRQFPFLSRCWRRYSACRLPGAGAVFSAVKALYRVFPYQHNNFFSLHVANENLEIVLDLLDLETYIHLVPAFSQKKPERVLLERVLDRGDTFVDVGANHGFLSLPAARLVGDSGLVISFEPQPRPFEALRRSVSANAFQNVQLLNLALSDETGDIEF